MSKYPLISLAILVFVLAILPNNANCEDTVKPEKGVTIISKKQSETIITEKKRGN